MTTLKTDEKPVVLQLEGVRQVYASGARSFAALENLDLRICEGEFVSLVGPAGCGKSTLLRIVTGLQRSTSGHVRYRGELLTGINPEATLVFQTFALFPWLTVQENVEVALKSHGLPPNLRATRAIKFLDLVGLDGFETAYPRELSRGMQQKVGVARALALEPELLCLDEPFSALDPLSAQSLRSDLLEIWSSGRLPTKAVIFVTHNIEEAVFMADRIIIMDKQPGRIIADVKVELPHPREAKSPEFLALVDRVFATLAGHTQAESIEMGGAPGEPGRKLRALVDVPLNRLTGLTEYLDTLPSDRIDLYRLASELKLETNALLEATEMGELLGLVIISHGDIGLTPLGETYAEASILARKEIFATRIRRLPMFRWILSLLEGTETRQMQRSDLLLELEREFPAEEAEKQINIVVTWGRYAEILAYDDNEEAVYLETAAGVIS